MQGKEEKIIRKEGKECIVFRHEDFGGQLLWALQHYVSIDEEGPESAFFDPTPLQGQGAAGATGSSCQYRRMKHTATTSSITG